jgi:ribose transport system permease protein
MTNVKQERTGRSARSLSIDIGNYTIIILIFILFLGLSVFTKTFFSYSNIYSILFGTSIQFFAIIGFTLLMIMGEIDLSIGGVYGVSGALLGLFIATLKIPFIPSLLLTLVICGLIGFINGFLVVRFRLISMMITIGMMTALRGFTSLFTKILGSQILPPVYRKLIKVRIGDIHWSVLAFIFIVIALEILLYKASPFRQMFYIGHNEETARLYGIKTKKVKLIVFMVSALTAGIGGILATSRITHAYPTTGLGMEFQMVTAAVLGGASLYGGRGSILRSVLGLLFLSIVTNGMIIFGVAPYYQQVLLGVILIIAVFVDTRLNVRRT